MKGFALAFVASLVVVATLAAIPVPWVKALVGFVVWPLLIGAAARCGGEPMTKRRWLVVYAAYAAVVAPASVVWHRGVAPSVLAAVLLASLVVVAVVGVMGSRVQRERARRSRS